MAHWVTMTDTQKKAGTALVFALAALFSGCSSVSDAVRPITERIFVPPGDPSLVYSGRVDFSVPGAARFAHSSTSVSIHFEGEDCAVLMADHPRYSVLSDYMQVSLDGAEPVPFRLEAWKTRYLLAENLSPGPHTVILFKRTEAMLGYVEFNGFEISGNPRILSPAPPKKRKMEFIGDSITCGYGVEADRGPAVFKASSEDSYDSYAAVAARLLDAEYITVCRSGIGIYRNFTGNRNETMPGFYLYTLPYDEVYRDFSIWNPDVVVINLGTNDFHLGPPPRKEFIRTYLEFIKTVRNFYPGVPIICMISSMFDYGSVRTAPSGPYRPASVMEEYMNGLLAVADNEGIDGIHLFITPNRMSDLGYGAGYHPGIKQNETDGRALAEFIRSITGWY